MKTLSILSMNSCSLFAQGFDSFPVPKALILVLVLNNIEKYIDGDSNGNNKCCSGSYGLMLEIWGNHECVTFVKIFPNIVSLAVLEPSVGNKNHNNDIPKIHFWFLPFEIFYSPKATVIVQYCEKIEVKANLGSMTVPFGELSVLPHILNWYEWKKYVELVEINVQLIK